MQFFVSIYLVKVSNDFIKQPETLHALVVVVQLGVELMEVGDAGEEDADPLVTLTVELLQRTTQGALLLFWDFLDMFCFRLCMCDCLQTGFGDGEDKMS